MKPKRFRRAVTGVVRGARATRQGFTLIELLVVVAIIALLISILIPSLERAREVAARTMCSTNLNAIGKAMALYRNENSDRYPMLHNKSLCDETQLNAPFTVSNVAPFIGTGWNGENYGDAVQQNFYLLIYKSLAQPGAFVCPSSEDLPAEFAADQHGFARSSEVSYGILVPTRLHKNASQKPPESACSLEHAQKGLSDSVAVAADRAPLENTNPNNYNIAKDTGSDNHGRKGSSVLFGNCSVLYTANLKVGAEGDNVYIRDMDGKGVLVGGMVKWAPLAWKNDSMIIHSRYEP